MWTSADDYLERQKNKMEELEKEILNGNNEDLKQLIEDKNSSIRVYEKIYKQAVNEIKELRKQLEGRNK